ncbi:MAG: hypothetical protein PF689_08425 [Deltaproteobacteria bacterium]|nr:hypothetical protein [Deltaproteobacteria bacterium]
MAPPHGPSLSKFVLHERAAPKLFRCAGLVFLTTRVLGAPDGGGVAVAEAGCSSGTVFSLGTDMAGAIGSAPPGNIPSVFVASLVSEFKPTLGEGSPFLPGVCAYTAVVDNNQENRNIM